MTYRFSPQGLEGPHCCVFAAPGLFGCRKRDFVLRLRVNVVPEVHRLHFLFYFAPFLTMIQIPTASKLKSTLEHCRCFLGLSVEVYNA